VSGDAIIEPSRSTPVYGEFDVVVVGGGPAGIMAATAAARAGCSTLLIERYGFLGGAGTAGGLSTFCGLHARTRGSDVRVIRGLADELLDRLGKLDGLNEPHLTIADGIAAQAFDISAYKIAADELVTGSGARILFHAMAVGAVMRAGAAAEIDAVIIESKSGRQAVRGRFFVDASGDGDLAAWAGVPWEKAPPIDGMMYPSLMFRINGVDAAGGTRGLLTQLAPQVPLLTDVKPNGETQITEFDAAGGTRGLLTQLAPLLDLCATTVGGMTLGQAIGATAVDSAVIRPLDAPVATHPAIVVMRGSLAPDGAVLKRTVADDAPLAFRGPAKVVRSRDEGVAAAKAGRFAAGDVVVLTGLGLRGSPGMGLTSALMFAIDGAGLSASVAVITDGQMSGLVNGGLVIAEVSPEGAAGGPLGLVRDGDVITIDVNARTVDLEVEAGELAARLAALPPLAAPAGCGWLSVYARSVAPLRSGATLGGR
jgi:hypothetical protein